MGVSTPTLKCSISGEVIIIKDDCALIKKGSENVRNTSAVKTKVTSSCRVGFVDVVFTWPGFRVSHTCRGSTGGMFWDCLIARRDNRHGSEVRCTE